jgi:hypothetical protein
MADLGREVTGVKRMALMAITCGVRVADRLSEAAKRKTA